VFSAVDEIKGIHVIFDVQNYHKRELIQPYNYIFILLLLLSKSMEACNFCLF
jgi:hypothetical protein